MKRTCCTLLALFLGACDPESSGDDVCVLPDDADLVAGQCNTLATSCDIAAEQRYYACLAWERPTEYDDVLGPSSAACAGEAINALRACYGGPPSGWCIDQRSVGECTWTCEAARAHCIDSVIQRDLEGVSWVDAEAMCDSDEGCLRACRGW